MAPKKRVTKTTPKTTPKTASASKTTPKAATRRTPTTRKTASSKTTPRPASPETTTNIPETATSPPITTPQKTSSPPASPQTASSPKVASPEPAATKTTSPEPATSSKTAAPEPATSPKTASPEPAASPKTAASEPATSPKTISPEIATIPKTASSETATSPKTTSPETAVTAQIATGTALASAEGTVTAANTTNAPKTKTTIKVVKKIVKRKVVTKRVKPKKEETEEKPQLPVEDEKPKKEETEENPQLPVEDEKPHPNPNPNPDQAVKIENPSSDVAETAAAQSSDQPEQLDSRNIVSENPEAMETVEKKGGEEEDENEKRCEEEAPPGEEENENERGVEGGPVGEEAVRLSERQQRRRTEIFIGGLDRDAKEEDVRKVFEKIGEVVEIRLMMNNQTGKNKGYAFLRYASAADAKRAITELAKVEICGKQCGAVAVEGNDTIFLGNIDKKWKKEDVMKLLQELGIENIDTVTVIPDHNNPDCNRGFAFLELETNKDAQIAYKKLQKKDVFGKNRNIKISWAEPLNEPDEEELLKVKSVYAGGIPSSWDEEKVRKHFHKFGDIERVALSRNMQPARRKDFAIVNFKTRESAISCIESFKTEELIDEGSKLDVKVSLAKPIPKVKHNKGGSKSVQDHSKEKVNAVNRGAKTKVPLDKGKSVSYPVNSGADKRSSTTHELLQVLRQQAAWGQGYMDLAKGSAYQDYAHAMPGGKRPVAALGDVMYSDPRGYPRARLDNSFPVANSSYSTLSHRSGTSLPYYQQPGAGYTAGVTYGTSGHSSSFQARQGAAPYGSGHYRR